MNLSTHIAINESDDAALHAFSITSTAVLRAAHAAAPFADADAVSGWMHDTWRNPRLVITTDNEGRTITVQYRESKVVPHGLFAQEPPTLFTVTCS
jgi:hypothetical protein